MISAGTDESTTKTETQTAPLSPLGMEYQSALRGYMEVQADSMGYDLGKQDVTEYRDKAKADSITADIAATQKRYDELSADLAKNPPKSAGTIMMQGRQTAIQDPRLTEQEKLLNQINSKQSSLDVLDKVSYTKYNITKKPDIRVTDAIEKYGADSPEAKNMAAQVKQEEVDKAVGMADVTKNYMKNLQKFVNGDMSYTKEQEDQINKYVEPIKNIINKSVDDMMKKYGDDDAKLREAVGNIGKQIDQTGFDVTSALRAAEIQMEKSGKDLTSVMEEVNKSTEAKFKFQQDLLFQDIDKQVSQQAAMLGLPPGSMAENFQKAKMKQDVFTQLQLELADQNMKGKMGIQSDVETGKKQISLSRVALASSQGEKKEGIQRTLAGITEATAGKEEAALNTQGNALLQLEQTKQNQLKELAYGNIPQLIGMGQSAIGFESGQKGTELAQGTQIMAPWAQQLGVEQQRQTTEATTTQTKSPSFMDTFSQLVGTAAAGAGVGFAGANMGSRNTTSTATQPFTPITLDTNIPSIQLGSNAFQTYGKYGSGFGFSR